MLQLAQEPLVDLCERPDFVHAVPGMHRVRDSEYPLVGRIFELIVYGPGKVILQTEQTVSGICMNLNHIEKTKLTLPKPGNWGSMDLIAF